MEEPNVQDLENRLAQVEANLKSLLKTVMEINNSLTMLNTTINTLQKDNQYLMREIDDCL
jgi:uncharacterized coiled-coil protein SlyX